MNEARLETIEQVRKFLAGTVDIAFTVPTDEAKRRQFVATVLRRFRYSSMAKGQRGVLFAYMQRLTGYLRQHLSRLIVQFRDSQSLRPRTRASRTSFARKYTAADVALSAELDSLHDTLSGPAIQVLARRARPPSLRGCAPCPAGRGIGVAPLQPARQCRRPQAAPCPAKDPALADHVRCAQSTRAGKLGFEIDAQWRQYIANGLAATRAIIY